jgi:hypothetical protein
MKEKNIAGRVLLHVFIGFTLLACLGIWLEKITGAEHHRALQDTGYCYWIENDGSVVQKRTTEGEIYE